MKKPQPQQLTTNAGSGFAWSLFNTVVTRIGTLGIGIVLARVLGPEQFGTYAVALVALLAVLSFNELGVSLAIVRWRMDPRQIAPTINTMSTISSVVFCGVAILVAPAFSQAMRATEATPVVQVLALSIVVSGVVSTPAALLQRSFKEKQRMAIDQVNVWVGAIVSVVLAVLGMGAMSLAIGRLAGSLVSAVFFLKASPIPYRFGWDTTHAPALFKFGLPLAGTSIVMFLVGYADQLIAGSMLGAIALGFYVLAFNLSSWPVNIISQPLRRVGPAALATLQHDPVRLSGALRQLYSVVAAATFPVFAAIAVSSESLVVLIYGQVWQPASVALRWLVIAALGKVITDLFYDYFVVIGQTSRVFAVQTGSLVVAIPVLVLGAAVGGIGGLAAAQAAVSWLVVLPLYFWNLSRSGTKVRQFARLILWPVAGAAAVVLCSIALDLFAVGSLPTLAVVCVLAGTAAATLLWLRRTDLGFLWGIGRTEAPIHA